jgi:hypothetical protein
VSKLEVVRADLAFEATFPEPCFALFEQNTALLDRVFRRLEPQGLRLNDLRLERGSGGMTEVQVVASMFNFSLTSKFRLDKIEVVCSELPTTLVESVKNVITGAMAAVVDLRPGQTFRAFSLAVGVHGTIEGQAARDYLARYASTPPTSVGPLTGNGAAFYFGSVGEQLNSSITIDMSSSVPNGLFLRTHASWDAQKVPVDSLVAVAEAFRQRALASLGLESPIYI